MSSFVFSLGSLFVRLRNCVLYVEFVQCKCSPLIWEHANKLCGVCTSVIGVCVCFCCEVTQVTSLLWACRGGLVCCQAAGCCSCSTKPEGPIPAPLHLLSVHVTCLVLCI